MYSKVILLAVLAAVAVAYPRGPLYDKDYYYAPKPYDYGYETKDELGSTQNRHESSDGHGRVKGSYGYTDPWGVFRQVDYIADEFGYRANVKTNEPGTANQDPANVNINADPLPGPVAPVRKFVGPIVRPYGPYRPYRPALVKGYY